MHEYFKSISKRVNEKEISKIVELERIYLNWKKSLSFNDFRLFIDIIEKEKRFFMKNLGNFPQSFGRLRSVAFEEYIFYFLKNIFTNYSEISILWDPKIRIKYPIEYYISPDFVVTYNKRYIMFVETKIEIDSQRMKAAMMDYFILKKNYLNSMNILFFLKLDGDAKLVSLAEAFSFDYVVDLREFSEEKLKDFKEYIHRNIAINRDQEK